MYDIVVIGGGVNGLVAATVLARRKLSVLLVDRQPVLGGAARTTEIAPGFRVPQLSHSLGPIRSSVARAIGLARDAVELITPDPALTSLGQNGESLVFHRDPVLTAASINRLSPADAARWRDFLKVTSRIGAVLGRIHRLPPPSIDGAGVRESWRMVNVARKARALGSRDLASAMRWTPMAVADLSAEWFEMDLLRAALSARAVFGHFAGPRSAGTGGLLLQRLAEDALPVGSGITARGGPGALASALAATATAAGVTLRPAARVRHVTSSRGRVSGVVVDDGEEIAARAVVSAVDPKQTFTKLVDPMALPPSFLERARNFRTRGVTAKVNLALHTAPVFPALHGDNVPLRGRLLIAPGQDHIERAFDAAKYGRWSPEPWLEISLPAVSDPALAPENAHVMSIYVHYAPRELRDTTWKAERDAFYQSVLRTVEPHAPGLPSLIVGAEVITPEDLEAGWGMSGGHIFHGEATLDQSWIARPFLGWARYRTPIRGLYLASAGTHPGGGLTGMSGLLAADAVLQDWKALRRTV